MFESGSVGECIHTSTSTSTSASEHFQCLSVFDLPALDLFDLNDARPKNEVRASCGPAVIESNVSVAKVLVRAAVQSIPICERLDGTSGRKWGRDPGIHRDGRTCEHGGWPHRAGSPASAGATNSETQAHWPPDCGEPSYIYPENREVAPGVRLSDCLCR